MVKYALVIIALGLAGVSAHADVTDSGNLTIGGTGVIQGTMTIQGAAFSVGRTTFSVAGGSVTLGGRLNADASGIKWADGSTSTTASSGGGGVPIAISSRTLLVANYDTTATAFNNGITTITIVLTQSSRVQVTGTNLPTSNTVAGQGVGLGFLVNGAYPDGLSSPMMSPRVADNGGPDQVSSANFVYTSTYAYAAGTYNIAIVLARYGSSGTARLACTNFGPCIFQAHTIP